MENQEIKNLIIFEKQLNNLKKRRNEIFEKPELISDEKTLEILEKKIIEHEEIIRKIKDRYIKENPF